MVFTHLIIAAIIFGVAALALASAGYSVYRVKFGSFTLKITEIKESPTSIACWGGAVACALCATIGMVTANNVGRRLSDELAFSESPLGIALYICYAVWCIGIIVGVYLISGGNKKAGWITILADFVFLIAAVIIIFLIAKSQGWFYMT